jgi:hypothetical protein
MATTPKLNLTRDQLATFLQNHEQIKQFENLFNTVDAISEIVNVDFEFSSSNASAAANQALTQIADLSQASAVNSSIAENKAQLALQLVDVLASVVNLLSVAPEPQNNNSLTTDYIDLNNAPPHVSRVRRLAWSDTEQTAELGMDYGVVQQIGLETYARVENATGTTITNGSVVGFAGVGANNTLSVTPYLADGTLSSLYILGVMTHDLPNSGEVGYCTVWGHVRDIDTTGTPVGEVWNVGDILYASPSTAGAFTNVKPTAPDNVIPVAAVLFVDATAGEIFVRPTIEQEQYYGEFTKTGASTAPASANTSYAVTWDNTEIANGVSIVSSSQLTVIESGLYQFGVTLQLQSNSGVDKNVRFWFKKNGSNIANTTRIITVTTNGAYTPIALTDFFTLDSGDYVELWWQADSTDVALVTVAAGGAAPNDYPAAPAGIIAVTQIQL